MNPVVSKTRNGKIMLLYVAVKNHDLLKTRSKRIFKQYRS